MNKKQTKKLAKNFFTHCKEWDYDLPVNIIKFFHHCLWKKVDLDNPDLAFCGRKKLIKGIKKILHEDVEFENKFWEWLNQNIPRNGELSFPHYEGFANFLKNNIKDYVEISY
ncbi:MAG: hypothetical protein ACOCUI_00495 [bacterium]